MMVLALIYRAPAAKKTHEHTLLVGARRDVECFGSLKVVLGKISALFADGAVRNYGLLLKPTI